MAANMYIVPMKRSAGVWLATIATMLTILFVGVFLYFFEDAGWLPSVVTLLIFVPLMVVTWLQAPQTLMIDRNTLTIGRRMKPVTISLGDIVRVERVESKVVRRAMRKVGNGGLWAYTGRYYHSSQRYCRAIVLAIAFLHLRIGMPFLFCRGGTFLG